MRRSHMGLFVPVAFAALSLLAAPTASAIYIITPLVLDPGDVQADVGGKVTFNVRPNQEWSEGRVEGPVTARFGYDPNQGQHEPATNPDEAVSSDNATEWEDPNVYGTIATVTLDSQSRGSFTWTVPAEVDDRNVFVNLVGSDGKVLATAHVAVGDAEPMMYALASSGTPRGAEGEPEPDLGAPDRQPATNGDTEDADGKDTPGLGIVLAGAALVAVAVLRRR